MTKTGRSNFAIILYLGILNALTPFTIDLYLPAFADIASDLNSTVQRVSLSVGTYFVGYAIGQLLYGPFLDRFGRKPPIYIGIAIYVAGSLGCMTATTVEQLLIYRFLAALGGSAASVGAITMVRDYFPPKEGARVFSMLMLVLSASPLFAPTLGSIIADHWGWRAIFGLLTAMAVANFVILGAGLPYVYRPDPSVDLGIVSVFKKYLQILKVPEFRANTVAGALSFAGLFVYLAGSPSIYIEGFGVSKRAYGLIFALLAVGMIGGGQVNNLFLRRWTSAKIFKRAVSMQVLISLSFVACILLMQLDVIATTLFLFALLSCTGISYPNAASLALAPFEKDVGSASSLLGFIQMGLGAILASLVGIMEVKGTMPTAVVISLSSIIAWIILLRHSRTQTYLSSQA